MGPQERHPEIQAYRSEVARKYYQENKERILEGQRRRRGTPTPSIPIPPARKAQNERLKDWLCENTSYGRQKPIDRLPWSERPVRDEPSPDFRAHVPELSRNVIRTAGSLNRSRKA